MEHNSSTTDRPLHVPPIVWVLGLGLLAALAAVFIFKVALSTVMYYGLFALMIGSHFFMHGSHGGHGSHAGHGQRTGSPTNMDNSASGAQSKQDEHTGHSGGCH